MTSTIKSHLINKFNSSHSGSSNNPIYSDLSEQKKVLLSQINKTLKNNESTTTLITGLPGSGKSHFVNYCLNFCKEVHKLEKQLQKQSTSSKLPTTIYLDGSVEIDDRRSVISIASQIGMSSGLEELDEEDEGLGAVGAGAETSIYDSPDKKKKFEEKSSLDQDLAQTKLYEAMSCVLNALKPSTKSTTKKIIIIIDRFEKIANRKMQILLYNLLDLARDGSVALCLIGLTTCVDIDSLLEKRVKSRFADRKNIVIERDFGEIRKVVGFLGHLLEVRENDGIESESGDQWNKNLKNLLKSLENSNSKNSKNPPKKLQNFLKIQNSPFILAKLCSLSVMMIDDHDQNNFLKLENFYEAINIMSPTKSDISMQLCSLSCLQFIAAICVTKVSERNPDRGINFEMVFREIMDCKLTYNCNRSLHTKAFQELIEHGLLLPLKGIKSNINIGSSISNHSSEMFEYVKYHSKIDRGDLEMAMMSMQKELPADIIKKANVSSRVLYN